MRFTSKLQKRLRNEESGFTLIELLIVVVIIGVLLAIAVPSYLGFKDRAERRAAAANVRAAIPSAEAIYADTASYATVTSVTLRAVDQGLARNIRATGTATTYCISNQQGNHIQRISPNGPGGVVTSGAAC